ncbi:MAG: amidohydrolase [Spirochaetes bacterium]|nr:amidohydrolase [Spirochaetota bacterium]
MLYPVIDAHAHLWDKLDGRIGTTKIRHIGNGRSTFIDGIRQMMPPYLHDGRNTAEAFIANMDYTGVAGSVITQEYIDGNQDDYLLSVKRKFPNRFMICALADLREKGFSKKLIGKLHAFDGVKVPAQWHGAERIAKPSDGGTAEPHLELAQGCASKNRTSAPRRAQAMPDASRKRHQSILTSPESMALYKTMEMLGKFLSIDLAAGNAQTGELAEIAAECPMLKISIGHFGMVTRPGWKHQILLARHKNVMIESGGITWLFHKEFYPYKGAVRAVKTAADLVGIEKLMWGSDYPRTMTAITYCMSLDFFTGTPLLSAAEKRAFLGGNAKRFYGFSRLPKLSYIKNMAED